MMYRISRYLKKIWRIIRWIPKLWIYEPWDQCFLFELLSEAVNEHLIYYKNPKNVLMQEKRRLWIVKNLTVVKGLLLRISEEDYASYWSNKLPNIELIFTKAPEKEAYKRVEFKHENRPLYETINKVYKNMEKSLRKRDIDLLCKILKTRSQGWWD